MLNWNGDEVESKRQYILIIFLFGLASETNHAEWGYGGEM